MKTVVIVAILVGAVLLVPGRAAAENALQSGPLKGGAGGLVCACSNLTQTNIALDFILLTTSGSAIVCQNQTAFGFGAPAVCNLPVSDVRICLVRRDDRKSMSAKQFRCTLASLDAAGNPIAVVPVDTRSKQ